MLFLYKTRLYYLYISIDIIAPYSNSSDKSIILTQYLNLDHVNKEILLKTATGNFFHIFPVLHQNFSGTYGRLSVSG